MTSVTTDRRQGVNSGRAWKVPVAAATTANIALRAEQTIDGVNVVTGDRVLVKSQNDHIENGIYDVDSGEWTRSVDFDGQYDVTDGTLVLVLAGTLNAETIWMLTSADTVDIDTDAITFEQAGIVALNTIVQVIDSIAELKALSVPTRAVTYLVRGFAAAGDGGGGFYWWSAADATADNGGSIIQLNTGGNGRFNRLF